MENENIPEPDVPENEAVPEDAETEEAPPADEEPHQEDSPEGQVASLDNVSADFYAEVREAQETGNEILGRIYAVSVFILALMFFLFVYLVIKNNITKHY